MSLLESIQSQLKRKSDSAVESLLLSCAKAERGQSARVVGHLAEIHERKIYLKRGFPSLHAYARGLLGYSEGSSWRRTAAARLSLEVPGTLDRIASGELSLCVAAETWKAFQQAEHPIASRSVQRETLPLPSPVLPAPPKLTAEKKCEVLATLVGQSRSEAQRTLGELIHAQAGVPAKELPRGRVQPVTKDRTELRVYLDGDRLEKFRELQALLSHKIPSQDPNEIFEYLLELGLEKLCPQRRQRRAEKRKARERSGGAQGADAEVPGAEAGAAMDAEGGSAGAGATGAGAASLDAHSTGGVKVEGAHDAATKRTRAVPAEVQRAVFLRAQQRCEYFDSMTQRRCEGTRFLELDHVHEFARGGAHTMENLRVLCWQHHRNRGKLRI